MAVLTREQISDYRDLPQKSVEVWGGTLILQALSALEMEELRTDTEDPIELGIKAIIKSAVDEDGNLVFDAGDFDMLGSKSAGSITALLDTIAELNGMDLGEAEADLEVTPTDETSSG